MPAQKNEPPAIGIIGGSGLYQIEELRDTSELNVDTPFGPPSDTLVGGKISGRQVYFLPRHGRGHRILPHEINHRANIYALRSLERSLDYLGGGGGQPAGKICAARRVAALAVL